MKWYFLFEYSHIMIPLVITLVTEILVVMLISKTHRSLLIAVVLVNLITNPLMNTLLITTNFSSNLKILYLFELVVIIIEGTAYYAITKNINKSFMVAIVANVCSYVFGMLLMPYIF
jgi:hypothetical protein